MPRAEVKRPPCGTYLYVVFDEGVCCATVAVKIPKDPRSSTHAYLHWIGERMVRALDRHHDVSIAVRKAALRWTHGSADAAFNRFRDALREGDVWHAALRGVGFKVKKAF